MGFFDNYILTPEEVEAVTPINPTPVSTSPITSGSGGGSVPPINPFEAEVFNEDTIGNVGDFFKNLLFGDPLNPEVSESLTRGLFDSFDDGLFNVDLGGPAKARDSLPASVGKDRDLAFPDFPDSVTLGQQIDRNILGMQQALDQLKSSGGGGGANTGQYDDAIRKIEEEIEKLRTASGQTDNLFGGIDRRTTAAYDRAIEAADFSDPAIAQQTKLIGEIRSRQGEFLTSLQAKTADRLKGVGVADEAINIATAGLEEIENSLYDSQDTRLENRTAVLEAGGRVAEASARFARASNRTDLERQRLAIQMDIDDQIEQMLEKKKEIEAARARAVAAARAAAARRAAANRAQLVANLPVGQQGYALGYVQQWVFNKFADTSPMERDAMIELFNNILPTGQIETWRDAKNFLTGYLSQTGQTLSASEFDDFTETIFQGAALYREADAIYSDFLYQSNPAGHEPWSLDRINALYSEAIDNNPFMSHGDAMAWATDESNHEIYDPRFNPVRETEANVTSGAYTPTTTRSRAAVERGAL